MSVCFVFFYLFILKTVAAWCGEMIPAPPPPPPPPPGAPGSSGDSASSSARSRNSKIDLITQATGLIDAIKLGELLLLENDLLVQAYNILISIVILGLRTQGFVELIIILNL